MAKERVGFIGLGIIGKPIAQNLLKNITYMKTYVTFFMPG